MKEAEETSPLPKSPDTEFLDALCNEVMEEFWQNHKETDEVLSEGGYHRGWNRLLCYSS
jgi:hypothetical protein